ncbi:PstS family phosphate ABC transporter substrate-binding protein [Dokdonella immobilis]|uniref:Phosphate transport system substrate-binding protein n=1 Tax=Dokdonella immobilis TaxID=578942 RepID=A0A1I5AKB7_9GAMM|nr:substrate-binding domain-containing protein [Dokdonella immobilis]SFN62931.1 phosphate transport system substrate-binding protein [Dokdonella immobilis]
MRALTAAVLLLALFSVPAVADSSAPAKAGATAAATRPAAHARSNSPSASQHRIVWRGDIVSARGFTNDLVDAFRKEQGGVLTVQPFSTVSGIDAVIDGSADVAGSARAMHDERDAERGLIFQPIALDAIVPVTHPKNPLGNITLAQLRQIYLGRISNWKDLGGADAPINLYSIAAPLDGVEFSFRRLLYRHGDQRIAAPRLYLNTAKLEEAIAIDPNSLGLTTLSSSFANKSLKMLSVEGISASSQSIADGSYPLFTTLYVVQKEDAPNRAAIDDFVVFLNSPTALQSMRRHQLVPYSEAGDVYGRDGTRLAFIDSAIVEVTPADVAAMPRAREVPPPMSAPRATLESSISFAPGSESTQKARSNLSRAKQEQSEAAEEARPPSNSN